MRRLEAAQAASSGDVQKFASDSWQNATFRSSDENDFLNRYGQLLTPQDHIARFDRILRDGRPQVARDLLPKLPPDYQPSPTRGWRWRRAPPMRRRCCAASRRRGWTSRR